MHKKSFGFELQNRNFFVVQVNLNLMKPVSVPIKVLSLSDLKIIQLLFQLLRLELLPLQPLRLLEQKGQQLPLLDP